MFLWGKKTNIYVFKLPDVNTGNWLLLFIKKNFYEEPLSQLPKYIWETTNWCKFCSLFACIWILLIYSFDRTRLTMQRYRVVMHCAHISIKSSTFNGKFDKYANTFYLVVIQNLPCNIKTGSSEWNLAGLCLKPALIVLSTENLSKRRWMIKERQTWFLFVSC